MLPPVETPIGGLQIADTCFYYPEDRGISESVRFGKMMAERVSMIGVRHFTALYLSEQFGRFLIVGGVALVLHWLSRFVFNWYVNFAWAIVIAYLVGMTCCLRAQQDLRVSV